MYDHHMHDAFQYALHTHLRQGKEMFADVIIASGKDFGIDLSGFRDKMINVMGSVGILVHGPLDVQHDKNGDLYNVILSIGDTDYLFYKPNYDKVHSWPIVYSGFEDDFAHRKDKARLAERPVQCSRRSLGTGREL